MTTAQLSNAGLHKRSIEAGMRAGLLHRVHHGVYSVGHPGISREGRWMAAVLSCLGHSGRNPGKAFLSHRSAASLWGILPERQGPIDVAIIGEAGRKKRPGIRVHRPRTLEESMTKSQLWIPVTDPVRTLSDLQRARPARGGASPGEVRKARRQASFLGLPLGPAPQERTRSELERMFLDLCIAAGLPRPEVNVEVAGLTVDFLWREARLVVETDGYRAHGGREAFNDDKRRDLRLRALGYDVMRIAYEQIANEATTVTSALHTRLAALSPPQRRKKRRKVR